ncbi:hypothetical protein [Robertmurraya kyonggiensis]|uniref:Uncharacterized protein n=1 Tax=Robertmurraya kyonggiensis TaxID=1037680 RepID=A0A4U1D285_9BACI|nr:hypothetical protein [Robertmurraya kyonggiensis]TKC15186.1 hypothetical protein FA727_20100 [Robertmurraya kyonggiensis]
MEVFKKKEGLGVKRAVISWLGLIVVLTSIFSLNTDEVYAAYSPNNVESNVQSNWSSKFGNKLQEQRTGQKLVYDVYHNKFTRGGFSIASRNFGNGQQGYANFQGWAVLQGYKRHTSSNNATYIVARKVIGTSGLGTVKIYRADSYGNLSASEDLEYNNLGSGIYNECPADAVKKDNQLDCNMRYDDVGFNAYLPVNELFPNPNESASWVLFLVKRVDNQIVWTPLILPFQFDNSQYSKGYISLDSGIDPSWLKMIADSVIRRLYPRQPVDTIATKYFTPYQLYRSLTVDESETAIWYGVQTPEDGNETRWGNTAYFDFTGKQALLSYRSNYRPPANSSCPAPVLPADRYSYQVDLEVTRIDGKTVDKGAQTQTKVDVRRNSFTNERQKARQAIQNDINTRSTKKNTLISQLATMRNQETQITKDLENAQNNHDFESANTLLNALTAKRQEIANTECHINTLQTEIDHYQRELDRLSSLEGVNSDLSTTVNLKFGNKVKGTQSVVLSEGQSQSLTFDWILTDSGNVEADINPNRTPFHNKSEVTFSNNVRATPIYVNSKYTPNACARPGESSSAEGIVRTVNSKESGQQIFREYVTTDLIIPDEHLKRRAGFGFDYTILTHYINQDSVSNGQGPSKVVSYMPDLVNYMPYTKKTWSSTTNNLKLTGYEVPIETTSTSGNTKDSWKTWKQPQKYVEEFSGNVFTSLSHPKRNSNETILDGGRKWYLSFEQPDGDYIFNSLVPNVGVNKMNTCVQGVIDVEGSIVGDPNGNDDFIKRSVSPENPFPQGTGWNWLNQTTKITSLADWYNNWISDPKQVSVNNYFKTFYLSPEKLEEIRQFSKERDYKIILGDSLFKSVQIPSK